jgi:predicted DNA-binding transcriptional regulator AlpA
MKRDDPELAGSGGSRPQTPGAGEALADAAGSGKALQEIRAQLAELRDLLYERNARASDLVTANYVHRRTGLSERTILEGKAGTKAIPRVNLGPRVVRFPKGAVDKFVEDKIREATAATSRARSFQLLKTKRRRTG